MAILQPEEILAKGKWWLLQQIKLAYLATQPEPTPGTAPNTSSVAIRFRVDEPFTPGRPRDVHKAKLLLDSLAASGAFNILKGEPQYWGGLGPDIFFTLIIHQPGFDKIYAKYEAACAAMGTGGVKDPVSNNMNAEPPIAAQRLAQSGSTHDGISEDVLNKFSSAENWNQIRFEFGVSGFVEVFIQDKQAGRYHFDQLGFKKE